MQSFTTTLLLSASLVAAAPHHRHIHPRQDILPDVLSSLKMDDTLTRMTSPSDVLAYASKKADCWTKSNLVWPVNDLPLPCVDEVSRQLDIFTVPETKPDTLIFENKCSYDIYYEHLNGEDNPVGVLEAGATIERPITGTVFKASKTEDRAKVALVEYNANDKGELWYNLSLVKCLGTKDGLYTTDITGCPGHDGGLQFGNQQMFSYQCGAGMWCDDQAYLYDENMCKAMNPVSVGKPSDGLKMEFCAGN